MDRTNSRTLGAVQDRGERYPTHCHIQAPRFEQERYPISLRRITMTRRFAGDWSYTIGGVASLGMCNLLTCMGTRAAAGVGRGRGKRGWEMREPDWLLPRVERYKLRQEIILQFRCRAIDGVVLWFNVLRVCRISGKVVGHVVFLSYSICNPEVGQIRS